MDSGNETPSTPAPGRFVALRQPLTRYQSIVGIGAGLITIIGTVGSLIGLTAPRAPGELVAKVENARSHKPVAEATIEILSSSNAVVTTMSSGPDGSARYQLREGDYRLRVTHPRFQPDLKDIQIQSGQRAEVRVELAQRPPPPPARGPLGLPNPFSSFGR